jgi:lipid A disaccharide synthetase
MLLLPQRLHSTHASLQRPLKLLVCAADDASDRAGAALLAALKQLHNKPLHIYGVVSHSSAAAAAKLTHCVDASQES